LLALGTIRLIRSWNQTGQKFAGELDVVKLFISPNPPLLWVLVIAAYIVASLQLMSSVHDLPLMVVTSITSVLVSSAFTFKLAFTAEDAPELVTGFARYMKDVFHGQSLLSRARFVFGLLLLATVFAVYQARKGGSRTKSSGMLLVPRPMRDCCTCLSFC
jgi:ethanolaminephosphotransferase